MKKLASPHSGTYVVTGSRLRLDDLEHILGILQRDIGNIRIADKHFEYASLDELREKRGSNPYSFTLDASFDGDRYASLSFQFQKDRILIHRSGSEKPFFEIREFLRSKRPYLYTFFSPIFWGSLSLVYFLVLGNFLADYQVDDRTFLVACVTVAIILFGTFMFSLFYRNVYCVTCFLRMHDEGFFRRNSDRIILLLIGTSLGALVSLLVQWIVDL